MFSAIINFLSGTFLDKIANLSKIFFGSKEGREQGAVIQQTNLSDEQKAVQIAYGAEFASAEKKFFLNRLIDAINRLVRPMFTYGTLGIFVWAIYDPVGFTVAMTALAVVPEMLWYMMLAIVSFWFGSRVFEKREMKFRTAVTPDQLKNVLEIQAKLKTGEDIIIPKGKDPAIIDLEKKEDVVAPVKPATPPAPPVAHPPVKKQNFNHK